MNKTRLLFLFVLLSLSSLPAFSDGAAPKHLFGKGTVTVHTHKKDILFQVETASRSKALEQGLMYRKRLKNKHGMLFLFPHEGVVHFWMKNTYIPLDMLFIDAEGKIITIAKNAKPLSETTISSEKPILKVLEIKGGSADKYGIRVGDTIDYE